MGFGPDVVWEEPHLGPVSQMVRTGMEKRLRQARRGGSGTEPRAAVVAAGDPWWVNVSVVGGGGGGLYAGLEGARGYVTSRRLLHNAWAIPQPSNEGAVRRKS